MEDIELESIGKLKPHPQIPDEWLISQPIGVPFFGDKEFKFILDVDLETDEMFLSEADETIENFLRLNEDVKTSLSNYIYQNYQAVQNYYQYEPSAIPTLELSNENDIWNYVYPFEIYVSRRHRRDKDIYVKVDCGCEWEEEHGLQLVFRKGLKLTRVSDIDGHLTEADAYNKADEDDELLSKF